MYKSKLQTSKQTSNKLINNKPFNNKTRNNLNKKEDTLLNKLESCKKTKCGLLQKDKINSHKIFGKEQNKQCPNTLSNKKYYNCTTKFYEKSDYKNKFENYAKCGNTKCKKEKKRKTRITKQIISYDMKQFSKYMTNNKKTIRKQ